MSITAKDEYLGGLRTEVTHIKSGQVFFTDAPVDNLGKGEAISPTDMVGAALIACKLTTMAIYAQRHGLPEPQGQATVTKIMVDSPRRIAKLIVNLTLSRGSYTPENIVRLEAAARACPVAKSLHPDLVVEVSFVWE